MNTGNSAFSSAALTLLFLLLSCSSNSGIDYYLDKYEAVVIKWENAANSGSITDRKIYEMHKDKIELSSAVKKLKEESVWTDSQRKRYIVLSTRFSKTMLNISQSSFSNYY